MKLHEFINKEIGKILGIGLFCGGVAVAGIIGDKYATNHTSLLEIGIDTNRVDYAIPYVTNPVLQRTNMLHRYK